MTGATVSVSTDSGRPTERVLEMLEPCCQEGYGFMLDGNWCVYRGGAFAIDNAADPANRPGGEAATG